MADLYPPQSVLNACLQIGVSGDDIYAHYPFQHGGVDSHVVECLVPMSRVFAIVYRMMKFQKQIKLLSVRRYDGRERFDPIELDNEVGYAVAFDVRLNPVD